MSRKYKLPDYQHGHAYLTSHRICYVDTKEPRKFSVAIDLRNIDKVDYQVGGHPAPGVWILAYKHLAGRFPSVIS